MDLLPSRGSVQEPPEERTAPIAETKLGVPFQLVRASTRVKALKDLERVVRLTVRETDGVILFDDKVFAALEGDVKAAERATERLKDMCARSSLAASVQLVQEPFSETIEPLAIQVIEGEVSVRPRERQEEIVIAPTGATVVRSDLARLYNEVRRQAFEASKRVKELEEQLASLQAQLDRERTGRTSRRRWFSRHPRG